MKKLDSILLKIFFYGLPVLFVYGIFAYIYQLATADHAGGFGKAVYDFVGCYLFGSWLLLSLYLSIRLLLSEYFREKVLTKLTFIKERDEREVMLTGKSAKTTMLTTIAILILLFFLSCFQFSVYHLPSEQAINGKTKSLSFGLKFALLERSQQNNSAAAKEGKSIVSYSGLAVSTSTVILGLLFWQIISYNYTMRRLMK